MTTRERSHPLLPGAALIRPEDVHAYLVEKAMTVAPTDVTAVAGRRRDALARVETSGDQHRLFQQQVDLATVLLADHAVGACPQIPYHTVSVLAVALLYLLQDIDVIPDFLPDIGMTDDALVMAVAFELAAPGIERYCRWKGLPMDTSEGSRQQRPAGKQDPPRAPARKERGRGRSKARRSSP